MFDALCHARDPALLRQAWASGVEGVLLGGTHPEGWAEQHTLAAPRVRLALGLHPWFAALAEQGALDALEAALRAPHPPDALGEIGLDRAHPGAPDDATQREVFDHQLALAERYRLPVVLHVVRAHGHALELLRRRSLSAGGVVHGFSGSLDILRHYVQFGLHISFGALLLHPHARRAQEAAQQVPLERLLVETDAPAHLEGPHCLPEVIAALAALRGLPPAEVATLTAENARRLYRLGASGSSAG